MPIFLKPQLITNKNNLEAIVKLGETLIKRLPGIENHPVFAQALAENRKILIKKRININNICLTR
jgi:hypothetical protein